MTTENTATEPVENDPIELDATEPAGAQIATSDLPDAPEGTEPDEDTQDTKPDKAEAKLRRRAQAAEAERDTLTGQVGLLRRQIIDGQVQATGARPEAFWAAGVEMADLLTDEGAVDVTKVGAEIASITERFGLRTRLNSGNYVPREGANPRPPVSSNAWTSAFEAPTN